MSDIKDSLNNNKGCTINVQVAEKDAISQEEQSKLLSKYYQDLVDNFTSFPILNNEKDMTLNDIYIEPKYQVINTQVLHKKDEYQDRFVSLDEGSIHSFLYQYLAMKDCQDALKLKDANIILLLGQPGQGKTSFSKKVIFDYVKEHTGILQNIYMLRLRDIGQVDKLLENPIEIITAKLHRIIGYLPNLEDETILLLDGLDELTMKEQLVTDSIDDFLETLIQCIKEYPKLKIILTSRTLYVNLEKISKRMKNDILTLHLTPFDLEQQIQWLERYKKYYPDTTLTEDILKQLHKSENQHILELIEQPILLHMITELNFSKEELLQSVNRSKIYNEMFNSIIKRKWEDGKEHENLKGIEPEDMRELLRTIAFEIYKSDYEYIHKSILEKLPAIKEFYKNLGIELDNNEKFEGILKGVLISFYFQEVKKEGDDDIEDSSNYAIEFLHKSLQEYLVAEKIFDELLRLIEKDRKKKYFIVDYKDVLNSIWELFSHQKISREIKNYLIEIIKNYENEDEKKELAQRLANFLPELFEKDFLYSYNLNEDINPMQKSLDVFYGYWIVLSNLGLEKNYIDEEFKSKFARYLLLLRSNYQVIARGYAWTQSSLILSNQKLDTVWLSGIHIDDSNIHKINLESSVLSHASITNSNITNANLSYCRLNSAYMNVSDLSDTDLTSSYLTSADLENVNFTNAILNNANLTYTHLEGAIFKNTQLNNITIDKENAEFLRKQGVAFTEKKEDKDEEV